METCTDPLLEYLPDCQSAADLVNFFLGNFVPGNKGAVRMLSISRHKHLSAHRRIPFHDFLAVRQGRHHLLDSDSFPIKALFEFPELPSTHGPKCERAPWCVSRSVLRSCPCRHVSYRSKSFHTARSALSARENAKETCHRHLFLRFDRHFACSCKVTEL